MSDEEAFHNYQASRKVTSQTNRRVLLPTGPKRHLWDIFTAFFVIYLCWMVPFEIGFDWWEPGKAIQTFHWFLDLWFGLDIVLNFMTGYFEYGFLITNQRKIAIHYFKTWFLVDFVATFPWNSFLPTSNFNRKTIKLLKYVKLPKLLRLGRLLRHFQLYHKYTGVTSVILGLLFFTHIARYVRK